MGEPNPETEQRVTAFYEEVLHSIEAETGKPVYKVPKEHELSNLRAYTDNSETPTAFENELGVLTYVPDNCFSRYVNAEDPESEKYRAWVYLPGSKNLLAVVVSRTTDARGKYVEVTSYLVDPAQPTNLKPELRATMHQRDFVTEDDYLKALPDRRKWLAENGDKTKNADWQYLLEGRDLTQKFDSVAASQQGSQQ